MAVHPLRQLFGDSTQPALLYLTDCFALDSLLYNLELCLATTSSHLHPWQESVVSDTPLGSWHDGSDINDESRQVPHIWTLHCCMY